MRGSLAAELLKLRKRPATWILGLILVTGVVLFYLLLYLALALGETTGDDSAAPEQLRQFLAPANSLSLVLGLLASLGGPVALILGALSVGSEYGWGTLKTIFTQRPSRLSIFTAKLIALAIVLAVFIAVALSMGVVLSYLLAIIQDLPRDLPGLEDMLRGLAAGWLISATWTAVGFGLAVSFRGTGLAIGFGLMYAIVLENVVAGAGLLLDIVQTASKALLRVNANALADSFATVPRDPNQPQGPEIPTVQATLVLLLYIVLFVMSSAQAFRSRDVT